MSSLLLFSLLLFLSIEACSGRSLAFGTKDSTVSSHDLSKNVDKASYALKPLKKGLMIGVLLGGANIQGLKVVGMKREAMPSGAVPILSHVMVSGSPTHKNRSKYLGVHVDYVGPKTHPPAHN